MPMGPAPLGFAAFVGVKLAGYIAAAKVLQRVYETSQVGAVKAGLARTGIGIAAGLAYGAVWIFSVRGPAEPSTVLYFLGLAPVRMGEWSLTLWLFFHRNDPDLTRLVIFALLGSLWSYLLDAIGIGAALVIPGGVWVC